MNKNNNSKSRCMTYVPYDINKSETYLPHDESKITSVFELRNNDIKYIESHVKTEIFDGDIFYIMFNNKKYTIGVFIEMDGNEDYYIKKYDKEETIIDNIWEKGYCFSAYSIYSINNQVYIEYRKPLFVENETQYVECRTVYELRD